MLQVYLVLGILYFPANRHPRPQTQQHSCALHHTCRGQPPPSPGWRLTVRRRAYQNGKAHDERRTHHAVVRARGIQARALGALDLSRWPTRCDATHRPHDRAAGRKQWPAHTAAAPARCCEVPSDFANAFLTAAMSAGETSRESRKPVIAGGVAHGTSALEGDVDAIDVFSAGRVCLLGEHSDWAGGFRRFSTARAPRARLPGSACCLSQPRACVQAIEKGCTIVVGTNQGLYARARKDAKLVLVRRGRRRSAAPQCRRSVGRVYVPPAAAGMRAGRSRGVDLCAPHANHGPCCAVCRGPWRRVLVILRGCGWCTVGAPACCTRSHARAPRRRPCSQASRTLSPRTTRFRVRLLTTIRRTCL